MDISFEDIYPVWKNSLWPGRRSPIERTSAMKYGGGYEMNYLNRPAFFFSIQKEDNLIGCVSCHPTEKSEFRMRGLWVRPEFRGQGLSKILFHKVYERAKLAGAKRIWSFPRLKQKQVYMSFGFMRFSEKTYGFDFSPNYYTIMDIPNF